ncbi:MAG: hypothetical protein OYI31_05060 [Chloroflexota bacterium]|nr:hypothetical protein [Chloroflexota bacterium]MDE2941258.1 hypothetical protein [Chloroflexota bacterium]MDE3267808.1 hypothetical protein [Chloroflexota bacterium]
MVFRDLVPEIPSTTYATFGLYKYPAKFIPQVIAYALKRYAAPGTSVIDPFAGYGTAGAVARIAGHDYELWDLNPLLKPLHDVAIASPADVDAAALVDDMRAHRTPFEPDWPNVAYWYPEPFLPMIAEAWGFYHSLTNPDTRRALLIPLMKTTRYFSLDDEKRQKLSRSKVARARADRLEQADWQGEFYRRVREGVELVLAAQAEYAALGPKPVRSAVRAGIDGLAMTSETAHDVLITSPPYLQAQEYIRASKMDLFWLGHSAEAVRRLSKLEFPYQDVPEIPIHSDTYHECLEAIREPHMARLYRRYFFGVLGTLTQLQERISEKLLLFVGPATIRTRPIPIDRIFVEHFEALGWQHEATLVDTIVSKNLFSYRVNPATGAPDRRIKAEQLVVLTRR